MNSEQMALYHCILGFSVDHPDSEFSEFGGSEYPSR